MDTLKQAVETISGAERKLGELVARAATAGEYETAAQIMDWAKTLNTLVSQHSAPANSTVAAPPQQTPPKARRVPPKGQYPKFFRRDDQLIKIGWSKTERREYEHKAPRRVIATLADAIARRSAKNGKIFTADDIFPLKDLQDGGEVPSYQAYVALAWLKSAALVRQHGRQGYSAKNGPNLGETTAAAWVRLPEKEV